MKETKRKLLSRIHYDFNINKNSFKTKFCPSANGLINRQVQNPRLDTVAEISSCSTSLLIYPN